MKNLKSNFIYKLRRLEVERQIRAGSGLPEHKSFFDMTYEEIKKTIKEKKYGLEIRI